MTTQSKQLAIITNFSTQKTGYGHWLITIEAENPNLLLPETDFYWNLNDKEDEPETITLKYTTTNSRAIDGLDGFEVALASECFSANGYSIEDFDISTLKNSDEE